MSEQELEQILLDFNKDPNFIELRERYSTRSFLEILSVERSENKHSSFLAWLLSAKDFAVNPQDHPVVHLMDILIRRMGEQKKTDVSYKALESLKKHILTRDFKEINIGEITREKAVQDVATERVKEFEGRIQDRLDIYIKGNFFTLKENEFEIIIENKIDSTERKEKGPNKLFKDQDGKEKNLTDLQKRWNNYCKQPQTVRYFIACNTNKRIFVFLTPGKDEKTMRAKDKHFINITYQDILDEIIEPLMISQNISQRVRVLLEEYVLALAIPAAAIDENDKKTVKDSTIMAVSQQEKKLIAKIFEKKEYKELIIESATIYRAVAALGNSEENLDFRSELLYKFCETNKALIIASLRILKDEEKNLENKKEYEKAYKELTSNTRDYSQYSLDGTNYFQKGQFVKEALKKFIENRTTLQCDLCKEAKEECGFEKGGFWPLLCVEWYENNQAKKGYYKRQNDDKIDVSIPEEIQCIRYDKDKICDKYIVSTQWGALPDKTGHFDIFLKSIVQAESFHKEYRGIPGRYENPPKELIVNDKWKDILGEQIYEKYDRH